MDEVNAVLFQIGGDIAELGARLARLERFLSARFPRWDDDEAAEQGLGAWRWTVAALNTTEDRDDDARK